MRAAEEAAVTPIKRCKHRLGCAERKHDGGGSGEFELLIHPSTFTPAVSTKKSVSVYKRDFSSSLAPFVY